MKNLACKIALVDNDPLALNGLSSLIRQRIPHTKIMWTAKNASTCLKNIFEGSAKPDILLIDISLAGSNGVDLCRQIRMKTGDIYIILVTAFPLHMYRRQAIDAGAQDLIDKSHINELTAIITTYCEKNFSQDEPKFDQNTTCAFSLTPGFYSPEMAHKRILDMSASRLPPILTEEEQSVLEYTIEGKSQKQIAALLSVNPSTVRNYAQHAREKLEADNLTEAAVLWLNSIIE